MSNRNRFAHMSIFHKILATLGVAIIATSFVLVAVISRAEELEDGVEVEKNTELTYYLHVKYDGVDVSGVESSDSTMAEVLSDRIKVTDVLPKGLTFKGFVTSPNGTFGAVSRADSSVACAGHVLDDTKEEKINEGTWDTLHKNFYYHGLHYNEDTRLVSFYVERLKAGCVLDIGIITQTPATVDDPETTDVVEIRRDFYNTAFAKEGDITARSNTVHVWMGSLIANEHTVTYSYTGDVPAGAPAVPADANYVTDAAVIVEQEPHLDGYVFSGWVSTDVTPVSGVFTMPDNDVAFVGNWVAETLSPETHRVEYKVYGETINDDAPEWAIPPKIRSYIPGTEVATDSTEEGMYDGYHFSGWYWTDPITGEEVKVGTGFVMPDTDVEIRGYYKRASYTVTYMFEGAIIPPNPESLLPPSETHYPGDVVTTAPYPTAAGYRFLGWYKSDTFRMPEEDVIIYGEWGIQNGLFSPTIAKEVVNKESSYIFGDTVQFKITLCNTAEYAIHDVILQEHLEGAVFTNGATSTVSGVDLTTTLPADSILRIDNIPANSCAITYASYVVRTGDEEDITNVVEMIGALADDYNNLDTTKDYIASDDFHVEKYNEPDPVTGVVAKNTIVFIGLIIITIIGGSVVVLNRQRS